MDLTEPGVASLSEDNVFSWKGDKASADKAVDGKSNVGRSAGNGGHNCAVTLPTPSRRVKFLHIALGNGQLIYYIRLHLRDEMIRYRHQNGLIVGIGNSTNFAATRQRCGSVYNPSQGQSPVFRCGGVGQYVWIVLNSYSGLQVCEVEVYADIRCLQPQTPLNGIYTATSLSYRGSLSLQCNKGFKATSADPVTCERSGNWSRPLPTCQTVKCESPPMPNNGNFSSDGFMYGQIVTYRCTLGYRLATGSASAFCQVNGKWNITSAPSCQRVSCKPPPVPANGMYVLTKGVFVYESIVTFQCDKGHYTKGATSARCLATTKWNATTPSCVRYCDPPTDVCNGRIVDGGDRSRFDVDTTVEYVCIDGYEISNKIHGSRKCLSSRLWSGTAPSCQPVDCGLPNRPVNGGYNLLTGATTFQSSVTFSCISGHELSGADIAQCQANGKWNTSSPSCRPSTRMDLTEPGVAFLSTDKVFSWKGDKASAEKAVDGKSNVGRSAGNGGHNCAATLRTPSRRVKFLRIALGHGQLIHYIRLHLRDELIRYRHQNGLIVGIGNSTKVAATRQRCGSVYNPSQGQSPVFRCGGVGQYVWIVLNSYSGLHVCEVEVYADIRCLQPQTPLNGIYTATSLSYRGSLSLQCNKGFKATTADPVTCERSGNWSRPLPACQTVDCGTPSRVASGDYRLLTGGTTYSSIVRFSCSPGHYLIGANEARCEANGKWNARAPQCRLSKCTTCHQAAVCVANTFCHCAPGYVGNGTICCSQNLGDQVTLSRTTAVFQCDKGCSLSFQHVTWLVNGVPVGFSQTRYGLARNGMLLYLENITGADAGEYTCEMVVGGRAYRRYGSLEVIDDKKSCLHTSTSCSSDCGKSCARKPFVARGSVTHSGEFPWQAMLCSPPQGQFCGGVLVSGDCIVTAAHCVVSGGVRIPNISACLGRQCGNCSEADIEGNPQCFKPGSITWHPDFDRRTLDNDVAVIKLNNPALCDCTSVFPVCLPNKTRDGSYIKAQKEGIVTGWGKVNSTVSRSTCLRKGYVRLASRRICANRHDDYPITDSMMCATDYNGACEGDSGGPLVVKNRHYGGRYVLAGIVSWGKGCGMAKKLGVYTSILSHVEWIRKICAIRE